MKFLQLIVDNSTAILGLLTAVFGVLAAFGLDLTSEQVGAIMTLAGAIIAVLAIFATVAKRKVVSLVDSAGVIRAGQASTTATGTATPVSVNADGTLVPQVTVKPELAKVVPPAAA